VESRLLLVYAEGLSKAWTEIKTKQRLFLKAGVDPSIEETPPLSKAECATLNMLTPHMLRRAAWMGHAGAY
jgi:hypothetical protein